MRLVFCSPTTNFLSLTGRQTSVHVPRFPMPWVRTSRPDTRRTTPSPSAAELSGLIGELAAVSAESV